jgi:predicted transcriptional regulator
MKQNLATHLPLNEREGFLKDNCDTTELMSYMKQFSPEEITEMKNRLSDLSIKLNDVEEERKELVKELTDIAKPIKQENKGLLKNIKHKAILVNEDCYKFIDQENNSVSYYNAIGDLVSSRPMLPTERQKSLFSIKSGTND